MSRETQVPAIPAVSDANLLQAVQAVKNALDVREGRLGDPLDQFVTLRELKALGLASDGETSLTVVGGNGRLPVVGSNGGAFGPDNYNESTDLTTPPAPTQLEVIGLYSSISLSWAGNNYRNHAYTEIWRSDTDNLGSASLVGTTIGNLFNDSVGTERTYFYWVRFVSQANVTGPYNSTSGTSASTALDVRTRIEALRQEILNDALTIELGTRINRLEAVNGLAGLSPLEPVTLDTIGKYIPPSVKAELDAVKASLDREKSVRGSAVISVERVSRDQATRITSLGTRVGSAESSITTLQSTTATQATQLTNLTTRVGTAESSITSLQTTTASQATSISSLTTRVGSAESSVTSLQSTTASQATSISSLTTRVGTAESSIVTLQNTTSSQATQINSLSTTLGTKTRTFVQTDAPTSNASYTLVTNDIWYDSDDGLKPYRWNGSSWVDLTDTRLLNAGSNITTLQSTTATQATQISSLNTRTSTAESNITSLQTTTSTQATQISGLTTRVGTAETSITSLQTTTANQATSISQLNSSVSGNTTSIQTLASTTNGLSGQYTVKIDNNGHVSGFGLASTNTTAGPASAFIVRADRFAIVGPNDTTDPLGTTSPTNVPFVVLTTPATIGGKVYPAGVWMKATYIADATITSAQIETLSADKITAGTITASIDLRSPTVRSGNISPGTAGFYLGQFGGVNQFYVGNGSTGTDGRSLQFDGTNATVRGNIFAYGGTIGSILIDANGISSSNYVSGVSGFSLNQGGAAEFNNITLRTKISAGSSSATRVEVGRGVGFYSDHHGISLSADNYSNCFIRRESDNAVFFRINYGSATNSMAFDTVNGILSIRGDIEATSIRANTVAVNTLNIQNNAVTIPLTSSNYSYISHPGSGYLKVMEYTFSQPYGGKTIILWTCKGFAVKDANFRIFLNFSEVGSTRVGTGTFQDQPTAFGFGEAIAGSNVVEIYFETYSGGRDISDQKLIVLGAQR
jgi:peptidoglycan hydrolase CwlO-like protein